MRSSRHSGIQQGRVDRSQAVDKKRNGGSGQKILYIVGIGPGSADHLSGRAADILTSVDTVAGYTTYIDLIRPLIQGKRIISTAMTKEVDRVEAAIDVALEGRSCAVVSSGDPGIYAMAGLVFEICKAKNIRIVPPVPDGAAPENGSALVVEVVPGIPALWFRCGCVPWFVPPS